VTHSEFEESASLRPSFVLAARLTFQLKRSIAI